MGEITNAMLSLTPGAGHVDVAPGANGRVVLAGTEELTQEAGCGLAPLGRSLGGDGLGLAHDDSSVVEQVVLGGHRRLGHAVGHAIDLDGGSHTQLIGAGLAQCEIGVSRVNASLGIADDAAKTEVLAGELFGVISHDTNVGEQRCQSLGSSPGTFV